MESDGLSLRHSFYKDLHKTVCYLSSYDALQSFLSNNNGKINHCDFVEFPVQIDYYHINKLKIKEDTPAKKLLADNWSFEGNNINATNYTPITLECTVNGNAYIIQNQFKSILLSEYEDWIVNFVLNVPKSWWKIVIYTMQTTLMGWQMANSVVLVMWQLYQMFCNSQYNLSN